MINLSSLKFHPFSYPIVKTETLIESKTYNEIKKNWPNFDEFKTTNGGQQHRNNLELRTNNENYKKIHPLFKKLYDELNSIEFRNFLKTKFDLEDAKKNNGFIGNFDNSELVMHIAESKDGYENPWHVDTRGRIIHFLIYFGDETIKEGGELAIGQHKKLNSYLDYKQYPEITNLEKIEYIKPQDNTGVFILSQNNSYHKGCNLKGLRRFIYAGYTSKRRAWQTNAWNNNMSFPVRLKQEKSQ